MTAKVGEIGIQRRAEAILQRRKRIERLEKLGRVRDYPEWETFAGLLNDGVETRKRILDSLIEGERNDDSENFRLSVRENRVIRDTLLGVIGLIKDPKSEIDRLQDEIKTLESEIKEATAYSGGD